jgi:hypothetical protein
MHVIRKCVAKAEVAAASGTMEKAISIVLCASLYPFGQGRVIVDNAR